MKKRTAIGAAALLTAVAAVGSCDLLDDPASSTVPALYGPPTYIETEKSTAETTTTMPDSVKTTVPPLYGPPELFESIEAENEVKAADSKETKE